MHLQAERPQHLRYLRSRLPSLEDAEDALQDATLKLVRHAAALTSIEKPSSWVGVSLRHTVIDRYRRTAAQRRLSEALLSEPQESPDADDLEMRTASDCLRATLPTLRPEYTALLEQVYLEGVSLKAAAKQGQLTTNNAGVRLHRARGALRQTLQRRCGTCQLDDCWVRRRVTAPAPA
nr:sigma-70 family RNA polymerase sigma factor [Phenylobacterium glaciei]